MDPPFPTATHGQFRAELQGGLESSRHLATRWLVIAWVAGWVSSQARQGGPQRRPRTGGRELRRTCFERRCLFGEDAGGGEGEGEFMCPSFASPRSFGAGLPSEAIALSPAVAEIGAPPPQTAGRFPPPPVSAPYWGNCRGRGGGGAIPWGGPP